MKFIFFEDAAAPEVMEEVVEEVTEVTQTIVQCGCNTESVVAALDVVSLKLDTVTTKLDTVAAKLDTVVEHLVTLQETEKNILDYLYDDIANIVALLLILVGFEIMRLVKGWYNPIGGKRNGRSR